MMKCYVCLRNGAKDFVRLSLCSRTGILMCGHYLCNDCFVSCRRKNIPNCQLCEKYLNATRTQTARALLSRANPWPLERRKTE